MKEIILGAVCVGVCVLLVLFSVAPIGRGLAEWSKVWEKNTESGSTFGSGYSSGYVNYGEYQKRYTEAQEDCQTRAEKFWGSELARGYASSTSGDGIENEYETYTCEGLLFTELR